MFRFVFSDCVIHKGVCLHCLLHTGTIPNNLNNFNKTTKSTTFLTQLSVDSDGLFEFKNSRLKYRATVPLTPH